MIKTPFSKVTGADGYSLRVGKNAVVRLMDTTREEKGHYVTVQVGITGITEDVIDEPIVSVEDSVGTVRQVTPDMVYSPKTITTAETIPVLSPVD